MQAQIKEKKEVAKGTLMVTFDLLGEEVDHRPGQYFWVELPDRGHDDERGLRRHITIVTSPNERGVLGLATRIRDTAFKRTLSELEVGDEVIVEEPKGDFQLPEDTSKEYVFIAGGIGITVFRSMLKYIAEEGLPYRITLLYSNRDRESTAFTDELKELERKIEGLRVVFTMTDDPGWDGEKRRIDADFVREMVGGDLAGHTYLVSGPPGMVNGVADMLEAEGVPAEQVLRSRFAGY
ncbi:MAG TPA: FAD-dependent oxidoreductase [Gaiellaceae bacterium]